MDDIKYLTINKNRGWRGLAELVLTDEDTHIHKKIIFSFSQPVWDDMLRGYMVVQDDDNYIVLKFNPLTATNMPRPSQQRSVLLKYLRAEIVNKSVYPKTKWADDARTAGEYGAIHNFIKNRNNHTTSDWNCIGVRVVPMI